MTDCYFELWPEQPVTITIKSVKYDMYVYNFTTCKAAQSLIFVSGPPFLQN